MTTKQIERKMSPVPTMGDARKKTPKIGDIERYVAIEEEDTSQDAFVCLTIEKLNSLQKKEDSYRNEENDSEVSNDMGGRDENSLSSWQQSTNSIKYAMISGRASFVSVIEGTKNLSVNEEKKRSPKHTTTTTNNLVNNHINNHKNNTNKQNHHHSSTTALSPPVPPPRQPPPPIPPRVLPGPPRLPLSRPGSPATRSIPVASAGRGLPVLPISPPPSNSSSSPRVPPISLPSGGAIEAWPEEPPHQLVDNSGPVPVPAKCSSQLRKLIHTQSVCLGEGDAGEGLGGDGGGRGKPIYPNLPYSPYTSPCSSPRVRRKPLKETKRVSSEQNGDYVQLNQYKLQGVVGMGSYGIVKLAYNEEDDKNYAMKILSKKKLKKKAGIFGRAAPHRKGSGGTKIKNAENPLDKVYREIAIMKKLDHPNVVKLVEVLDDPDDDQLYMVFELLERGEVLEVPTESPLTEEEAWSSFRDVILGLEYLHYQKIIHRDIKPSNLLRADSGEVKIADLGVSNEFDGSDAFLTSTAGTPAFTPPESLAQQPGEAPYSGRTADIWSLGVTLYSLVFGKVPFHDENILALYNKIRAQELQMPEKHNVSKECVDLISRMLVKRPENRITLQEIKEHDWTTCYGLYPMLTEDENCDLIEVTEHEVQNSVRSIPKLDTLILVKAMLKQHSFSNPFSGLRGRFGRKGGRLGRSNSAPGAYDIYIESKKSNRSGSRLPSLSEQTSEEEPEHRK